MATCPSAGWLWGGRSNERLRKTVGGETGKRWAMVTRLKVIYTILYVGLYIAAR